MVNKSQLKDVVRHESLQPLHSLSITEIINSSFCWTHNTWNSSDTILLIVYVTKGVAQGYTEPLGEEVIAVLYRE